MANELDREISMEYEKRLAREEGLEEGQLEAKREIAGTMKELGLDVQIIAKSTGLSVDEIAVL